MASLWKVSIYLLIYFLSSTCVEYNIFRFCCRAQPVRVVTVTVLGQFWHGWIGKLWIGRHQIVHTFLGPAHVRLIQCDQCNRLIESAYCHDVQLVCHDYRRFHTLYLLFHFSTLFHICIYIVFCSLSNWIFAHRNIPILNGNSLEPNYGWAILRRVELYHRLLMSYLRLNGLHVYSRERVVENLNAAQPLYGSTTF